MRRDLTGWPKDVGRMTYILCIFYNVNEQFRYYHVSFSFSAVEGFLQFNTNMPSQFLDYICALMRSQLLLKAVIT